MRDANSSHWLSLSTRQFVWHNCQSSLHPSHSTPTPSPHPRKHGGRTSARWHLPLPEGHGKSGYFLTVTESERNMTDVKPGTRVLRAVQQTRKSVRIRSCAHCKRRHDQRRTAAHDESIVPSGVASAGHESQCPVPLIDFPHLCSCTQ